ncbi:hypothetical protein BPS10C_028 [Bacillus phage BPS10C]|uniref:Uncharacterized protein n=1 Tax=Bacillus phage BPS10C TaxID=1277886 RepID=W5QU78_9CAUD|nr:hypothetical protein BPS10C_028 [Bacillus phage BPS10C]AGI12025.1 hypothetical protein BPS10C_028 [Bacillus phage BPS10C]
MFKNHDEVIIRGYSNIKGTEELKGKVVSVENGEIGVHVDNPIKGNGPSFRPMFFDAVSLKQVKAGWRAVDSFMPDHYEVFYELVSKHEARQLKSKKVIIHMKNGGEFTMYHEYSSSIESLVEDDNKTLKFFNKDFTKSFTIRLEETIMFEEDVV